MNLQAISGRIPSMRPAVQGVRKHAKQGSLSCMMFANLAYTNKEARIA